MYIRGRKHGLTENFQAGFWKFKGSINNASLNTDVCIWSVIDYCKLTANCLSRRQSDPCSWLWIFQFKAWHIPNLPHWLQFQFFIYGEFYTVINHVYFYVNYQSISSYANRLSYFLTKKVLKYPLSLSLSRDCDSLIKLEQIGV